MGSIKPLPVAVRSSVRSGFIIAGLTTLVEELIYNSLDAGATKVSVYVGVNNGYVKVEDDGSGISRDGLVLLGERYATSKLHHFHDKDDGAGSFGFRGEVLCSIADISLIEIVTKVHGRANGYRKVMKGRKCLYLSIDNDRQDVGTTVIVRDLFYNQPVRRRQMQSSGKKVLHSVKECAVRISLVQPKVSFKIVDMESEDELLRTHASSSPLPMLCNNFGFEASSLHELSFSKGSLKLEGYVSGPTSSIPLKAIQYIYVNSRFIVKGSIHKVLNHLADTFWDQLSCDKGGKRGHPNQGPIYCLNLTCPRSSYDLSLEFSRTTVEFKDWAPILTFIEQSVASLWSKSTKIGESSNFEDDQIGNIVEEKIVGNMTLVQKDWLLRTCETSTKKRRIQSSEHEQASAVSSPCSKEEMQVKFGEPETKRPFCNQMDSSESDGASPSNCCFDVKDSIDSHLWEPNKGLMSFNEDLLENDITTRKKKRNYGEDYLSSSRLIDELRVDHANARSIEVGSGWSFELRQENHRYKVIDDCKKLFPPDCSWGNLVQTPLDYDENSIFEEDNFNAKRSCSNSTGSGYADGFIQTDTFLRAQCQKGGGSCWPLPKFNMESDMWNDLDITSMKCCDSLSSYKEYIDREHNPESLSKQDGVCSSCFSVDADQHSAILYPFLSMETCDFEHLIRDGRFERRSKARSCDGFEESNDDKEGFYSDDLDDRCCYENYSSTSCLNSTSLFRSDYAGVGKGIWEFSPCGHSINDITAVRYGDFPEETSSPCMNRRGRDYRSSPSVCQALEAEHISEKRLGRIHHHCSPDGRLSDRCDDTFADGTFSSCLVLKRKLNTHGLSVPCVSPISVDEGHEIDFQRCQVPEPNCSFPEQSGICCTRLRRSYSAPPLYRGKRRFVSVMNCLLSTAESPAVQTTPQGCNMTEKGEMEHPPGWPLFNSEHVQHHETTCTEDSLFCIDRDVKETSKFAQLSTWAQDDITESACCGSGYLKQVQDSESSLTKWREGSPEDITKRHKVGDRFNQVDENTVLDIHSCMLHVAGDSLVPKSINRTCLESAKVLLQVDNKFIPVVASGTLAVIDQHAADERIRLEEMRQKVLSGEMKSITYLQEEKDLVLPEMSYQLLCNYAEHIQHWGWICNIFCQDSGSFAKNLNLLNPQPNQLTLLAVPCILGVNLSDADLLEFLEQLADTDGSSTIPPSVLRILNFKACRGAIMFGDMLLPSECSLIVEELKRTSLCFQCAHGRPTTAPLVNLEALRKGIAQLGSWHEGSNNTWHGLCRKEINIRRAKHRLDKARGCG